MHLAGKKASAKNLQAKKFYVVIDISTIIGLWINFANIDPIKALVYTAIINGIVAVPIFIAVMKIANDRKILKEKHDLSNLTCMLYSQLKADIHRCIFCAASPSLSNMHSSMGHAHTADNPTFHT